jgi:hypothetical protein
VIDSIKVSNFVLTLYSPAATIAAVGNDFLGTRTDGKTLRSFRANPGGYIVYFDPKLGEDTTGSLNRSDRKERLALKRSLGIGRGHRRRMQGGAGAARV